MNIHEARVDGLIAQTEVNGKAETRSPGFNERARALILRHLREHGPTSGEDLTDACKEAGLRPHDDRAFGGVFNGLSRRGLIQTVDITVRRKGRGTIGCRIWGLTEA